MHNRTFPVNEECTSLKFSPSGRLVVAGFADGTVRLFDLTGRYLTTASQQQPQMPKKGGSISSTVGGTSTASNSNNSDSEASFSSEHEAYFASSAAPTVLCSGRKKTGRMVLSKEHQQFGAVACQIHAKGVHTSLLMDVDVAEDCQWCFAGVVRGSMELTAVHLGALEASFDYPDTNPKNNNNTCWTWSRCTATPTPNCAALGRAPGCALAKSISC